MEILCPTRRFQRRMTCAFLPLGSGKFVQHLDLLCAIAGREFLQFHSSSVRMLLTQNQMPWTIAMTFYWRTSQTEVLIIILICFRYARIWNVAGTLLSREQRGRVPEGTTLQASDSADQDSWNLSFFTASDNHAMHACGIYSLIESLIGWLNDGLTFL